MILFAPELVWPNGCKEEGARWNLVVAFSFSRPPGPGAERGPPNCLIIQGSGARWAQAAWTHARVRNLIRKQVFSGGTTCLRLLV